MSNLPEDLQTKKVGIRTSVWIGLFILSLVLFHVVLFLTIVSINVDGLLVIQMYASLFCLSFLVSVFGASRIPTLSFAQDQKATTLRRLKLFVIVDLAIILIYEIGFLGLAYFTCTSDTCTMLQ